MNMLHRDMDRFERWLADFDERIAALEDMVSQADGYRQRSLQNELDKLRVRRHKAGEHLAEMRLMDAESWSESDFRTSVFAVFDDIGARLSRLLTPSGG